MEKVKVLVVDDSKLFCETIKTRLSENPRIDVVGTAEDAFEAKDKIGELSPDVLILDVQMPKMDGRVFLASLMKQSPMPCIIVTSSDISEKAAMDCGAAGFMRKPRRPQDMPSFCTALCTKILLAAKTNYSAPKLKNPERVDGVLSDAPLPVHGKVTPSLPTKEEIAGAAAKAREGYIIALGASTGGTDALECVIRSFDASMPPIVVVQHMPPVFTKMYAERLDKSCAVNVREAVDGDRVRQGDCIIGAGGSHLYLKKDKDGYYIKSAPGEKVSGHCPSVDVLFNSVADTAGNKAIAALLTGMGADGAKGMLKMHNKGAYTIGQDKDSCVVYGMPMEAYKLGACAEQQPLKDIGAQICRRLALGWTDKDINKRKK